MNPFSRFPRIERETILLREIVAADLDALCELYQNPRIYRYIPGDVKKTRETVLHMVEHFARDFQKGKELFLAICPADAPDRLVGVAEVFDYDPQVGMVTIGYRLCEEEWGKGYAARAVRALCDYLFCEVGLRRIQAFVMPENTASLRVLDACGFSREGLIRQGNYWKGRGIVDLVLFSLLEGELRMKQSGDKL